MQEWDGFPDRPAQSGWCWVEDADGLRPLLWRGADWPERADRGAWQDGVVVLAAADLAGARFLGRIDLPPAVAARFRMMSGLTMQNIYLGMISE
jgi:hypothetical protein